MAERRAGTKGRRLGSSRRRQLREPPVEPTTEQKVLDVHRGGEQEHRVFSPRAELQESQPEGFPGSREELQVVLTELGADGTRYLMDQQFTDGLSGQMLSSQQVTHKHHMPGTASLEEHLGLGATPSKGVDSEEREHFSAFMEQLGTDDVLEDRELWELWVKLWQDKPRLLGNLEDVLAKMRWRIQEAKSEREALEVLLNQCVATHSREVQQLCEALEQQIRQEAQQLEQESEARSLQQGTELWRALDVRESQVQRLLSAQAELETRCRSLRRARDAAGIEKQRLERSNRLLQEWLQRVRLQLHDTQGRLRAARDTAAHVARDGSSAEQPGAMLPSPQTSPGQEKYRSEMRIRLGSQSDERPPKSGHHVVWEKAPAEITLPSHQVSSVEEDPFPEMLETERFSEQSSLLQEMNEAIVALSKETKPLGPARDRPLGLPEDVTLRHRHNQEAPHGDPSHTGTAPAVLSAQDETVAGASQRAGQASEPGAGPSPSSGAAGQGLEKAPRTVLGQGQAEQTGWEEAEYSQGESVEAGEEVQAEEAKGAGHLEGQSSNMNVQVLTEDEELGFTSGKPSSWDAQQGGSPAPYEQSPGEVDGPRLGLQEGSAAVAAAAAGGSGSLSPAETPAKSSAPDELLPGTAPGLETEADEGQDEEREAKPSPQRVPISVSPQGAVGCAAEVLQQEAAHGALGQDERALPCELETAPCEMQEEGAGTDVQPVQEARNMWGLEGQSRGLSMQVLAEAKELTFTLGKSVGAGLGPLGAAQPWEGMPGQMAALEAHMIPVGSVPTRGTQPHDEATPGAETLDLGASQGAFAGIPCQVLEMTLGEGADVCSSQKEGALKSENLQAKIMHPEFLTPVWGALDREEIQGKGADLEVSSLETPKAEVMWGDRASTDMLEEPKEVMLGQNTNPALQPFNIHGVESLQGEGTNAEVRPLDGACDLDVEQGANYEAGKQFWGQIEDFQLKQGSEAGTASPMSEMPLPPRGRSQATLMQEDVLIPDVTPLGTSGWEQFSTQADKVRPDVAPEQLLPKEKLLQVMELEQAAAEPPKVEVAPVSTLLPRVQCKDNIGSNPMGTLEDSPLRDTANSGVQPSAQLAEEQRSGLDVGHEMVNGHWDGKQDVGLKGSQEAKPRPEHSGAILVHGAGRAPRGSPETCPDPDHLYNVLFVGDSHVGKTSFLYRLHANCFNPHLTATVEDANLFKFIKILYSLSVKAQYNLLVVITGLDYQIKNLIVDNKLFTLRLWDSAGQERYHSITKQFFRKADGVVLMYDITSEYSFADVRYWLSCIQEGAEDGVTVLLLGNKTDCTAERRVPRAEGERLAQEHQLTFYECSAASGHNVSESMTSLIRLLKIREDQLKTKVEEEPKPARKKWGCC